MTTVQRLPLRQDVPASDTWDLASLFPDQAAWDAALTALEAMGKTYAEYKGKLKESAATVASLLEFDLSVDRLSERVGTYAFLRTTEDQTNNDAQAMYYRFQNVSMGLSYAASYIRPELLDLPAEQLSEYLDADEMKPYRLVLERIIRYKKHTLGRKEEELLSMQAEMAATPNRVFKQLVDSDLKFGSVQNEKGELIELSNATYSQFLISPDRNVRKTAFHQYYEVFQSHENTLAATLAGSVLTDVYNARSRNYESSVEAALFPDNVPVSVYDNLISTVRKHLPVTHDYFEVRRRKMGLETIHHYDTYVPILTAQETSRSWDETVALVMDSLRPLGDEYCNILRQGFQGRWCDRYPNKGKQSGAFSCGTFDGDPYILMNYKPNVLNDVFTLTHEAGHSMHSYYSAKNQPFQYYNYTIFVAEVASTFNEQLLSHYMIKNATSNEERAYLINHEIDSIRATIVRQTMFAEFEKQTHQFGEEGKPLTVAAFKDIYSKLLSDYFGPRFQIDDCLSLECFRIPHFYRAFYVYKYATGLSAAIALSRRVLQGGASELKDYFSFLQGGCSKDPLDLLKDAGVDMTTSDPIDVALSRFGELVKELDSLL